jgi:hypothetical protein
MICPTAPSKLPGIILHQQERGDYRVFVAGRVIGSVSRYQVDDGDVRWLWYLTGVRTTVQGSIRHGDCGSLALAKEALQSSLRFHQQHVAPLRTTIELNDHEAEKK